MEVFRIYGHPMSWLVVSLQGPIPGQALSCPTCLQNTPTSKASLEDIQEVVFRD
jgi:hypothetical protein